MDLAKMTTDELLAENQRLMAERGKAEQGYKAQQHAIQQQINKTQAKGKLEDALAGLDPDARAAMLAEMMED